MTNQENLPIKPGHLQLRTPSRICPSTPGRSLSRFQIWTCCLAIFLAAAVAARSQPLAFGTLAGSPGPGSADGAAANAQFRSPQGVARDSSGNVYVADSGNNTVRRISPVGEVVTLAGLAGASGSNDGSNSFARFSQPAGVAVDAAGNIYVADSANDTIRKIMPAGAVTTLAGRAGVSGSANGTGTNALFNQPQGLAVDTSSNVYVADYGNHTIRKITPAGAVTTLAGLAGSFGSTNGTGTNALFYQPQGVAVDGAGNVYVADTANAMIRKITSAGVVTTLAGSAGNLGSADGTGTNAQFYQPEGVALDDSNNVYVADYFNNTLRKITSAGVVTTLAGLAGTSGSTDGTNNTARFWGLGSVAVSGSNNLVLYLSDTLNNTIREVVASGTNWVVSTYAGLASNGRANGAASSAQFGSPQNVAVDGSGNVYVADTGNSDIRKIAPGGVVSTFAGTPGQSGSADGTGTNAQFYGPQGLAVGGGGNLYVADSANNTIRKISSGGTSSTLAGLAGTSGNADGTGTNALFNQPQAVALDTAGNIYVADSWNNTIRQVSPAGAVVTLAGLAGSSGSVNGSNSTARFYWPAGIAVNSAGNVFVSDSLNHTIRELSLAGTNWSVTTVAGTAGIWGNIDGTNGSAEFYLPRGIVIDGSGDLYVSDSGNHTIRKVTPVGTNWVVSTVAGLAGQWGDADGAGTSVLFDYPAGLAMGSTGNVYAADSGNDTIRTGWLVNTSQPPIIIDQPQSQSVDAGSTVTFGVAAAGLTPLSYQWRSNTVNIAGATGAQYTLTGVQSNYAGGYSVVVSNQVGGVTSSNALLSINGPPLIVTQPAPQYVSVGQSATFTVAAVGAQPLVYQWFFNGTSILGATSASLTLPSVQVSNQGSYFATVTNGQGVAVSSNAPLAVVALLTWGDDTWGELDLSTNATNVIAIAAGEYHSLALETNGTVLAWGNDVDGQCDVPDTLTNALAIAAGGYHSLAIQANGTVVAWGDDSDGQTNVPPGLANVIAIAAGTWHSLALQANGNVVAWGDNSYGQTNMPAGASNIVAIAAGGSHNLALQANGTVIAWGQDTDSLDNYAGQSDVPTNLSAIAIGAGEYHSLAVRANGSVVAWGANTSGQCNVPTNLTPIAAIVGGGAHTVALGTNGSVAAWGANTSGQCNVPANATNAIAVAAGESHTLALVAGALPVPQLYQPAWQSGQFGAVFQTLNLQNYVLEYVNSLGATNWTSLPAVPGNGALRLLGDPSASAAQRFYRVQQF